VFWRIEGVYQTDCGCVEENRTVYRTGIYFWRRTDKVYQIEDIGCTVANGDSVKDGN
jgi:hypothetical protein